MKTKLIGPVQCLKCNWEGEPNDLKEKNNGEIVICPACEHLLMDFTDGQFIIQDLKAESMSITG